jgi:hypothetical protein
LLAPLVTPPGCAFTVPLCLARTYPAQPPLCGAMKPPVTLSAVEVFGSPGLGKPGLGRIREWRRTYHSANHLLKRMFHGVQVARGCNGLEVRGRGGGGEGQQVRSRGGEGTRVDAGVCACGETSRSRNTAHASHLSMSRARACTTEPRFPMCCPRYTLTAAASPAPHPTRAHTLGRADSHWDVRRRAAEGTLSSVVGNARRSKGKGERPVPEATPRGHKQSEWTTATEEMHKHSLEHG